MAFRPRASNKMAIKSKLLLFTIIIIVPLLILVYVMILNKSYLWKISTDGEFEKINYVGRHSAAVLGRGFQTRPGPMDLV